MLGGLSLVGPPINVLKSDQSISTWPVNAANFPSTQQRRHVLTSVVVCVIPNFSARLHLECAGKKAVSKSQ